MRWLSAFVVHRLAMVSLVMRYLFFLLHTCSNIYQDLLYLALNITLPLHIVLATLLPDFQTFIIASVHFRWAKTKRSFSSYHKSTKKSFFPFFALYLFVFMMRFPYNHASY